MRVGCPSLQPSLASSTAWSKCATRRKCAGEAGVGIVHLARGAAVSREFAQARCERFGQYPEGRNRRVRARAGRASHDVFRIGKVRDHRTGGKVDAKRRGWQRAENNGGECGNPKNSADLSHDPARSSEGCATSNVRITVNVPLLLWFLWIGRIPSSIEVMASYPLAGRNGANAYSAV
jgi:hypothetical protein